MTKQPDGVATHPLNLGILRGVSSGERRVAVVPESIPALLTQGYRVLVEHGAGRSRTVLPARTVPAPPV